MCPNRTRDIAGNSDARYSRSPVTTVSQIERAAKILGLTGTFFPSGLMFWDYEQFFRVVTWIRSLIA